MVPEDIGRMLDPIGKEYAFFPNTEQFSGHIIRSQQALNSVRLKSYPVSFLNTRI